MRFAPAERCGPFGGDHEAGVASGCGRDTAFQHLEGVAADGVHLRVERDRKHTVAKIDEAGGTVLSQH